MYLQRKKVIINVYALFKNKILTFKTVKKLIIDN